MNEGGFAMRPVSPDQAVDVPFCDAEGEGGVIPAAIFLH